MASATNIGHQELDRKPRQLLHKGHKSPQYRSRHDTGAVEHDEERDGFAVLQRHAGVDDLGKDALVGGDVGDGWGVEARYDEVVGVGDEGEELEGEGGEDFLD